MGKQKSKPHIYLLLNAGLKPKELIALGYKKITIYQYSSRFKRIKEEYDKDIRRLGEIRE